MQDKVLINPGWISGKIKAYPSKSYIQRALALGLLNKKGIEIRNYKECSDSNSVLASVKKLGAKVEVSDGNIKISGHENFKSGGINCKESGLCLRMFVPILALSDREYKIKGTDLLLNRGNEYIPAVLNSLGAECRSDDDSIYVKGPIKSGNILVKNPTGSQLITGLMFALSKVDGDSIITIKNPVSFPYIKMTSELLNGFGADITINGSNKILIGGNRSFTGGIIDIEGDWSSAAFYLVAGAISGQISVSGLNHGSLQPDAVILDYLKTAGAKVELKNNAVSVKKADLTGFEADIKDHPDLFIPLVILALNSRGISKIYNYSRLKFKESDRPSAIISELKKAGAKISAGKDFIRIEKSELNYCVLDTHNDHRLAMGFAVAALNSVSGLEINNTKCVSKSYPVFFGEFKNIISEIIK